MSKIVFLCGLFPDELRESIERNSKGMIQYAADMLQWSIVKGLDTYVSGLKIVNLPYVGSFPFDYKASRMQGVTFSHKGESYDVSLGFTNIVLVNLFSRYMHAKNYLKQWSKNIQDKKIIVVYAIHTPFIKAAVEAKRTDKNVKICLIVPDLPEFMGGRSNIIFDLLRIYQSKLLAKYMKEIDGFVVLSKYMVERLNIEPRPWVCMEGICDNADALGSYGKEGKKTILYSGLLSRRYGIMNLLHAFEAINDPEYKLWICGDGDCREEIEKRASIDTRIKYLGVHSRNEVLMFQKRATVLVNPRISDGEFTKYSFPAKTMEYYASGTPTVMHRLPGIPEEYFQYCVIPDRENAEGLRQAILSVCEMSDSEREAMGKKAREFIITQKNPSTQVGKIFDMLSKL